MHGWGVNFYPLFFYSSPRTHSLRARDCGNPLASVHLCSLVVFKPCLLIISSQNHFTSPVPSLYPSFTPLFCVALVSSLLFLFLPSRGVMPSMARVLRPRCLRWLLLENRSCGERGKERRREGSKDETKLQKKRSRQRRVIAIRGKRRGVREHLKGEEEDRLGWGRKRSISAEQRSGDAEWNWDKTLNWGGIKVEI